MSLNWTLTNVTKSGTTYIPSSSPSMVVKSSSTVAVNATTAFCFEAYIESDSEQTITAALSLTYKASLTSDDTVNYSTYTLSRTMSALNLLEGDNLFYVLIQLPTTETTVDETTYTVTPVSCTGYTFTLSAFSGAITLTDDMITLASIDQVPTKLKRSTVSELESVVSSISGQVSTNALGQLVLQDYYDVLKAELFEAETILANKVDTETLEADYIDADTIEANYAHMTNGVIDNATIDYADVNNLNTNYAHITSGVIDNATISYADVDDLEVNYIKADATNITDAVIEKLLVDTGLFESATVSNGVVTGYLDVTKIRADSIVANQISILGEDGLYYALNTKGETSEVGQTLQNALDGSHLIADSVTASKVNVDDLVAFEATIGGFYIDDDAIRSFNKSAYNDGVQGVYIGSGITYDYTCLVDEDGNYLVDENGNLLVDTAYDTAYDTSDMTFGVETAGGQYLRFGGGYITINTENFAVDSNGNAYVKKDDYDYVKISSSGFEIYQNDGNDTSEQVASFGTTATIGVTDGSQSYLYEDYHSLQMIDKEGDTYFHISDLRDANGIAEFTDEFEADGSTQIFYLSNFIATTYGETVTITDTFEGDGSTTTFTFSTTASDIDYTVTSNGIEITSGFTASTTSIVFDSAPSSGVTITIEYTVDDEDYFVHSASSQSYVSFDSNPLSGAVIAISYTSTRSEAKGYTLGIRDAGNVGAMSLSEGYYCVASGRFSHSEGYRSKAFGFVSHAEGQNVSVSGYASHGEGYNTTVTSDYAHGEGYGCTVSGKYAHGEGYDCVASGLYTHAEGALCEATDDNAHAEGHSSVASGRCSHAQNAYTIANGYAQTAIGAYNVADTSNTYAFIIGNGSSTGRSNAFTVSWEGNTTANAEDYSNGQAALKLALNGNNVIGLHLGSGGDNHGVYSWYDNTWLVHGKESTSYVYMPLVYNYTRSGSTYVNVTSGGLLGHVSSSSRRYKTDIEDIENAEALYDIPVRQFVYKDGYLADGDIRDGKTVPGFIAEEVEEVYQIAVNYDDDGLVEDWDMRYMLPPMLKLIQDQKAEIDTLRKEVDTLKAQMQIILEKLEVD